MDRTSNQQRSEQQSIKNRQNSEKESSGVAKMRNTPKQSV